MRLNNSDKMKLINFVSRFFFPDSPGGAEKVFYELYKRAKKDYKIKIISSYRNKKRFPKKSNIFKEIGIKNTLIRYIYYTINMTLRANIGRFDLIHANNLECIRLTKKPYILNIHHVGHLLYNKVRKQTPFTWFQRQMLRFQANRADIVVAVSENTKRDLKKIGVKSRIVVIPNGVDINLFKPIRKRNKKFIITHFSRISPEKAQHLSVEAYLKLPKKIREKCELHIVGFVNDKDYYNSLKREKGIKYITNLTDKELAKEIAKSDLVIFPTLMSEGFGLVVLEAMACGVPVIATDQKAIREAGGDACIYFKQGDVKMLIKKIVKLYKDKELRKRLIKKGLKRAKQFSWDNTYKRYKQLYEELLR